MYDLLSQRINDQWKTNRKLQDATASKRGASEIGLRAMKVTLKKRSLSLLVLLPFALFGLWFAWGIGIIPDLGLESGYYGQFNRVKHVIEDMSGVTIVDHWQHKDVSLEDFGFTLRLSDGSEVNVEFLDATPEKNERNQKRLRQIIEKQINSTKTK